MSPPCHWADLPVDILLQLFDPLEIGDLIRVSAVCSSFEKAVSVCQKYKAPPPLITLYSPTNYTNDEPLLSDTCNESGTKCAQFFYALSERKVYQMPQERPFCAWKTVGSSHGWLVKADEESNLHLFNPNSNKHVSLPPNINMEGVNPVFDDKGNIVEYMIDEFGAVGVQEMQNQFTKVVLSKDPSDGDYTVMLVYRPVEQGFEFGTVAKTLFTKGGDKNWTLLPGDTFYHDFVFSNGFFYGITELGRIHSFDLSRTEEVFDNGIDCGTDNYDDDNDDGDNWDELTENLTAPKHMLMSPKGEILVIWRKTDDFNETKDITVFKIDIKSGKIIELDNLGEYSLFMGTESGFFYAKDTPGVKSNSVYFTEGNGVAVYDLTKKEFKRLWIGKNVTSVWIPTKTKLLN